MADGALEREAKRIRYRSLGTSDWSEARSKADEWLSWGATIPVSAPDADLGPLQLGTTIESAVKMFIPFMEEWGWTDGYQRHFEVLLKQRLIPWATKHKIVQLEDLTDLEVSTAFVYSWINLNPNRNRKGPTRSVKLAIRTRKSELTRFRYFMSIAFERKWISANPAPLIRIGKKKQTMESAASHGPLEGEERYGLTADEYQRVERAASLWTHSQKQKELIAITPLLRWSGLRISDAATLDAGEIVRRQSGEGHAIHLLMMKTRTWVYVPIPEFVYDLLMSLPIKGVIGGKKYFFWTGKGGMDTCIKNFENDIAHLMHRAQEPKDPTIKGLEANYAAENYRTPFEHRASTHTLRHTFATLALGDGATLEEVKEWLGHGRLATTERFYAHASPERRMRSDQNYDRVNQSRKAF